MRTCRIFKGSETKQVDGTTRKPANPKAWYFEPVDYEGDTLWSRPERTLGDAINQALKNSFKAAVIQGVTINLV